MVDGGYPTTANFVLRNDEVEARLVVNILFIV